MKTRQPEIDENQFNIGIGILREHVVKKSATSPLGQLDTVFTDSTAGVITAARLQLQTDHHYWGNLDVDSEKKIKRVLRKLGNNQDTMGLAKKIALGVTVKNDHGLKPEEALHILGLNVDRTFQDIAEIATAETCGIAEIAKRIMLTHMIEYSNSSADAEELEKKEQQIKGHLKKTMNTIT